MAEAAADLAYTPRELAERFRIASARKIREAIRAGELPAFRVGHWNRVRLSDFQRWIETLRFRPGATVEQQVEERVAARLRQESQLGA
jgi:excisionase family DNA binding protein